MFNALPSSTVVSWRCGPGTHLLRQHCCYCCCLLLLFVGCLTSQQHTSVSQRWISSDNFMTEVADQIFYLTPSLTSQQHASVSQRRTCSENYMCCHTAKEVADPTFYLTQAQYNDTGQTSPSADPISPGAGQSSHWSAWSHWYDSTRKKKPTVQAGIELRIFRSRGARTTRPTRRSQTTLRAATPRKKLRI